MRRDRNDIANNVTKIEPTKSQVQGNIIPLLPSDKGTNNRMDCTSIDST